MLYDSERARQPKADTPDLDKRRAARNAGAEPVRASREGSTGSANPARTQVSEHRLLSAGERELLAVRLQQAVTNFLDSPRQSVEEADSALTEVVTHLTKALADRQKTLRANWQSQDTRVETEELRVALQQYRETTERLLGI
ncbi:hypothetical protein AB0C89_14110 [Streptomyces sp. NPDC048491]|uniref:hypothetical protein n=1 Tax=Streptomyces sp. NPDC048491 TaxID=3157207 RepID=UPI00343A4FBE